MRSRISILSFSVVPFPILTILGSIYVPMLNYRASSICLLGFFPLKTSFLSKRCSKGTLLFGKVLFWRLTTSRFMESTRKFTCESVNSLLFSMNLMIWSSYSKTCQCSKLLGIEGLKNTSIFHGFWSGPSQGCKVEAETT
jgi:hypothetical protein